MFHALGLASRGDTTEILGRAKIDGRRCGPADGRVTYVIPADTEHAGSNVLDTTGRGDGIFVDPQRRVG